MHPQAVPHRPIQVPGQKSYTILIGKEGGLFKDPTYVDNTDAESGWVAAHVFCEGLKRLVGKDVTWESFMKALESAPIDIPFGGEISFADGARKGVSDMLLSKVNTAVDGGWEVVYPMDSIENIIAGKQ